MKLIYFKTDKNGTKYYHDWTCPRCGGAGEADKWMYTGKICFACGGTGKRNVAKVVKEYTPEHWAKLQARANAKAAKRAEEAAKYAEEHAEEIAEQNRQFIIRRYADLGCGENGVGYVLTGNTYPVKDEIKKNGGKWIYGRWICPVEIAGKGIFSKQIDLSGHIGSGSEMWLDHFDFYDEITRT